MRRYIFFCSFMTSLCLAQTPAASPAGESDGSTLAEVIVTAQKRAENLQDVPVSVQVVGGLQMREQNLNSLEDVGRTVPSVHINATGSGGQIFIRGIGSGTNQTFDQSVGIFTDDIYHGRARVTGGTFLDLDHLEILKGPQSTFFGNNAIAGAFNIVTKKPDDHFGGYARALYGQDGQYAVEGAASLPVSDQLAVRIAALASGIGGWQKNPYADSDQPNDDNQAARATLLFHPNDDFDATLKVEGSKNRDRSGSLISNCPPPAPFVTAGFCKAALALNLPTGLGSDTNTTGPGQGVDLSTFETTLTANYRFGGNTVTSVTGFYNYHSNQDIDADATPSELLNLRIKEKYHQFSQELRIISPADQPIEYLGGVYYQMDGLNGEPTDLSYFFLTPTISSRPALANLIPYLPLASGGTSHQDEHSYAVFGSLSWNATDRLKVSAGLRGSWVYKHLALTNFYGTATQPFGNVVPLPINLQPLAAAVLGAQTSSDASRSDSDWLPSARIQYKLTPDAMLYASYARGFKAGVPTGGTLNGVTAPPVLPERVDAYEVGIKSKWNEDRILLNLDVFRSDYTDQQVQSAIFTPLGVPVFETTNAGASRSQGVEMEAEWEVVSQLRLSANLTYLDSYYVHYPNVTAAGLQTFCRTHATDPTCAAAFPPSQYPSGIPALQDLSGQPTEFAPKWTGNLTATFSTVLPRDFKLTAEGVGYFTSHYNYANNGTNDPLLEQGGYARIDARLTLETPGRQWAFDIIGKNLADRIIVPGGTGGTSLPSSLGSLLLRRDEGRNIAAQARYRW